MADTNARIEPGPSARLDPVRPRPKFSHPGHTQAHPFLKWAGGKRALVQEIIQRMPEKFGTYWEPFLGGGAVYFALHSRIRRAELSDINRELIQTYHVLQGHPGELMQALCKHAAQHARHGLKHYKKVRDACHDEQDPVRSAARFIYLNRTCYNGLYRVNRSGRFNVPMGRYKNPTICNEQNLQAVSKALRTASLKARSFVDIAPEAGDLVYCDPPYDGTFSNYTGAGFAAKDQTALRDACEQWRDAGAHVIISNSDTKFMRSLFDGWSLHHVRAQRNISCKGGERGKAAELLVTA